MQGFQGQGCGGWVEGPLPWDTLARCQETALGPIAFSASLSKSLSRQRERGCFSVEFLSGLSIRLFHYTPVSLSNAFSAPLLFEQALTRLRLNLTARILSLPFAEHSQGNILLAATAGNSWQEQHGGLGTDCILAPSLRRSFFPHFCFFPLWLLFWHMKIIYCIFIYTFLGIAPSQPSYSEVPHYTFQEPRHSILNSFTVNWDCLTVRSGIYLVFPVMLYFHEVLFTVHKYKNWIRYLKCFAHLKPSNSRSCSAKSNYFFNQFNEDLV